MNRVLTALIFAGILATSTTVSAATQKTLPDSQAQEKFTGAEWFKLSQRDRADAVASFIKAAKGRGITIKKSAVFYAKRVDAFYEQHAKLMTEPVAVVLKTLMIMEYDWTIAGLSKDELARSWLGDELYAKNKKRLKK